MSCQYAYQCASPQSTLPYSGASIVAVVLVALAIIIAGLVIRYSERSR